MKLFIIQSTKFILIGVILYAIILAVAPPSVFRNFYSVDWNGNLFMQDAINLDSVDVLVLGSSHVFRSFDPRVFQKEGGYQLFNLASPGQTPKTSYYMLKDFLSGSLSKTQKAPIPKVIVHELYCKTISDTSILESYIKSVESYPPTYSFFKLGIETKNLTSINMFLSTMLKKRLEIYDEMMTPVDVPYYVKNGYYKTETVQGKKYMRYDVPIDTIIFENEQKKIQYGIDKKRDANICKNAPSEEQLEYLKMVIELANSHHIPMVLSVVPIPSDFENNIFNYDEITEKLYKFAEENNVLLITDFGSVGIDENKDFLDRNHLNNNGAQKVSRHMLLQLKERGYLK